MTSKDENTRRADALLSSAAMELYRNWLYVGTQIGEDDVLVASFDKDAFIRFISAIDAYMEAYDTNFTPQALG